MSVSQNDTILEIIEKRLIPDEQAKKARGEVFTPLNLVRESLYGLRKSDLDKGDLRPWGVDKDNTIVDNSDDDRVGGLPLELWRDPDSKWLDPANGIGNFPFVAFHMLDFQLKNHGTKGSKEWSDEKRRKHIVEKMLYMIEIDKGNVNTSFKIMDYLASGSKPNICCADTLKLKEADLQRHFGVSKFDVVMGNPPFTPGAMWSKFITWSLSYCRILTFVLPSAFTSNKTGEKVIELLKSKGLHQVRFINKNEFPGINVDMLYLTTDTSKKDQSILINNKVLIQYTDSIVDYKPQKEELSIFKKIQSLEKLKLYKGKNKTLNSGNPQETDNIKKAEDPDHPNKMLSRLGGGDLEYFWLKSAIREENTQPKIVFPRATGSYNSPGTLKNFDKDIVFTTTVDGAAILSDSLMYIPIESAEAYDAYRFYILRSKLVRLVFLRINHLTELTPALFNYIPKIPVAAMTNDNDIYNAIGLTSEERNYIESVFGLPPLDKNKAPAEGGSSGSRRRATPRRKSESPEHATRRNTRAPKL